MGGKRPQEGNIAWKMSHVPHQRRKGDGRGNCSAIKSDGSPCLSLAIKGWHRCYHHGGMVVLAKRKLQGKRKLKHAAWTAAKEQRKRGLREKATSGEIWNWPSGGGV